MNQFGRRDNEYDEQRVKSRKQTRWYEFVSRNNMIEAVRDIANPDFSHTLLAGGVLNVPIERYDELLMLLSQDIDDGVVPDFNEISPPITRLYMDLDFKDELPPASADDSAAPQLYSRRVVKELDQGSGSEKFPAIVIEEEPLERRRYHNLVVVNCIANKVAEYFPAVADHTAGFFHVHCMWRPARFKFKVERYVNTKGQHVEETKVVHRSFGMHLVWPNLYVTHEQALHLREGVIRALAAKFLSKGSPNNRSQRGLNSWEAIVDEKVYLPVPSMRMILSDKYELCGECAERNLKRYGCKKAPVRQRVKATSATATTTTVTTFEEEDPFEDYKFQCVCHGTGKVPCNSVYAYEATFDAAGRELTKHYERSFKKNTYKLLAQCCIRDPSRPDLLRQRQFAAHDHQMQLPVSAPRYPHFVPSLADSLAVNAQRKEEYVARVKTISATVRQYADDDKHELLTLDTKEFMAVQNMFNNATSAVQQAQRKAKPAGAKRAKKETAAAAAAAAADDNDGVLDLTRYANITVHRLRRGHINGSFYYLVDVADNGLCTNAAYCHNVQRLHTCDKNVYFKITAAHGIVQKCLCWGKEGRLMPCKRYESPPCALPKSVRDALFSDALMQRGALEKQRDIVAAATTRAGKRCTGQEIQRRSNASIEYQFEILAVDDTEVDLLTKYVQNNQTPVIAEQSNGDGSSHSPYDPVEAVREQKYNAMHRSESGTINVEGIEQTNLATDPAMIRIVNKVLSKRKDIGEDGCGGGGGGDQDDADGDGDGNDCATITSKLTQAYYASMGKIYKPADLQLRAL